MKKIIVQKEFENLRWIDPPKPAIRSLPDWYKKMSPYSDGSFQLVEKQSRLTVKKCVPFLDSLSSGYMLHLPCDILVDKDAISGFLFNWQVSYNVVSEHGERQIGDMSVPPEYVRTPFKWNNNYIIKTPPGYSCMISHPHNRIDLPFYTLSAVVDTDSHNLPINFPFFIRNDFTGVIEKGTPIAQVLPFKRESWQMKEDEPLTNEESYDRKERYNSKVMNFYRKSFWSRKEYR